MGQAYLVDSNVIIDAQMGKLPEPGLSFLRKIVDEDFTISCITYIEVLGYEGVPASTQNFIGLAQVIDLDKTIIDACINIRGRKKIKLPDAIIAATALVQGRILLSRNPSDFNNIAGVICVNPYDPH